MKTRILTCAAILWACGCGGAGGGNCAYIGGTSYTGTETLNGCGYNTQLIETYEFYQSKDSCNITINTPLESCTGQLNENTLTWVCPMHNGITYQQATGTFSSDLTTFNGSFKWSNASCSTPATTTLRNFTKN